MTLETDVDVRDRNGEPASPASDEAVAQVSERLGNFPSFVTLSASDDGTGSTLPAQTLPHGVEVAITADPENADVVHIGPAGGSHSYPIEAGKGVTLALEDTSEIGFTATSAGDSLNAIAEVEN